MNAFANVLVNLLPNRSFLGVCAPNSTEWMVADLACTCVYVEIRTTLDIERLVQLIQSIELEAIACSKSTVSYIPLSHSTDRMRVYECILNEGRVGCKSLQCKELGTT